MEVIQVLHMKEGEGETSYASNSSLQLRVIFMTKPIVEEAITKLYCGNSPTSLAIADLGCSSGPNSLFAMSVLIKTVDNIRQKLDRISPEYHVYLNDLPGNDFNILFKYIPSCKAKLKKLLGSESGPCFFTGVPGSFYDRLFPRNSLHFVHSSYSLMWLSQVPEELEDNKRNIYMAKSSPPNVIKAYYEQFQQDFSMFLKCRSEEIVKGGRMVLTILGRRSDDPTSKECCYIWELMALALNDMVSEGLIEEEKLNSFNIPQYTPSAAEVRFQVKKEGSFGIDCLEVMGVDWNACSGGAFKDGGYNVAKCMRAVAESMLESHFGEAIINEVFDRYRKIVEFRMSREKTEFVNVIISLEKH